MKNFVYYLVPVETINGLFLNKTMSDRYPRKGAFVKITKNEFYN